MCHVSAHGVDEHMINKCTLLLGGGVGGQLLEPYSSPLLLSFLVLLTLTDLFRTVVELDPSVHLGGPASR